MAEIGIVGLGRIGAGIGRRLLRSGVGVVGFDTDIIAVKSLSAFGGFVQVHSLRDLVVRIDPPRAVWLALPPGRATADTVRNLATLLDGGDLLVDCGNNHYVDTVVLAKHVMDFRVNYIDVGLSGGLPGENIGYCLMVGGDEQAVRQLEPILNALAKTPPAGWAHVGPAGAGHFTKMIHNGIEYGVMQAISEGCSVLQSCQAFTFDIQQVLRLWMNGSLLEGTLMRLASELDLGASALRAISPTVADLGTGRWFVKEGLELGVPTPTIAAALQARLWSQDIVKMSPRIVALLRNAFGGHKPNAEREAQQ